MGMVVYTFNFITQGQRYLHEFKAILLYITSFKISMDRYTVRHYLKKLN